MQRMLGNIAICARKRLDVVPPRPVPQSDMEETTLDTGLKVTGKRKQGVFLSSPHQFANWL